ncbi:hypothetical protein YC2023_059982 [Brassica napus]
MTKYTNCVDPTERAARQERFRLAEEEGEVEEAATNMLLAELASHEMTPLEEPTTVSPRVPALQRLWPSIETAPPEMAEPILKRKPGRPPGPRRIQSSPKTLQGSCSKKRKTQQTKPPLARRKLSTARGSSGTGAVAIRLWKRIHGPAKQVGVKAHGTAKRMVFFPAIREETVTVLTPP